MREYLFRGQTRKKGEKVWMDGSPVDGNWVYGGVNQGKGDFSIIYQTEPEIKKFPVYTDTLGQYTGLTDKNGKKIFEGDIVRYTNELEEINAPEIGVVVYEQSECHFEVQRKVKNHCNVCIPESINVAYLFDDVRCSYEVIGNIHDDPELVRNTDIL